MFLFIEYIRSKYNTHICISSVKTRIFSLGFPFLCRSHIYTKVCNKQVPLLADIILLPKYPKKKTPFTRILF